MIIEYADLFWDVASCLFDAGLLQDAISFYTALQDRIEQDSVNILLQLGKCYVGIGDDTQAEERFQQAILMDDSNVEVRMQLAKLCERNNDQEQAFIYVNQVMDIQKRNAPLPILPKRRGRPPKEGSKPRVRAIASKDSLSKGPKGPKRAVDDGVRRQCEEQKSEHLKHQYEILRAEHSGMQTGQESSILAWMNAAKDLTDDFRSFRTFYPWDKYLRFMGFSSRQLPLTGAEPLDNDLATMAERLSSRKYYPLGPIFGC